MSVSGPLGMGHLQQERPRIAFSNDDPSVFHVMNSHLSLFQDLSILMRNIGRGHGELVSKTNFPISPGFMILASGSSVRGS